jgi:hypothetical protein
VIFIGFLIEPGFFRIQKYLNDSLARASLSLFAAIFWSIFFIQKQKISVFLIPQTLVLNKKMSTQSFLKNFRDQILAIPGLPLETGTETSVGKPIKQVRFPSSTKADRRFEKSITHPYANDLKVTHFL